MAKKKDLNDIRSVYTERENSLIDYCIGYASGNPQGLPGHTLMIIIGKMFAQLQHFKNVNDALTMGDSAKEEKE